MPFETGALKTIEYLSVPSVVGHEWSFLCYLEKDFEKLGLNVTLHDGAIEVCGDSSNASIVTAHADRHGLISLGKGEYAYAAQYVKEIKYGENDQPSVKALQSISKRFMDELVFAYDPQDGERLGAGSIETCLPCMANGDSVFWVHGLDHQPVDTPVAYARTASMEGQYLKGQIDNAISLAVIYVLFQNGYQGTALITTEEEIGYSWKHIANWLEHKNIETRTLLALDTSPFKDSDPVKNGQVIFRSRDKSDMFNEELVSNLTTRCEELGYSYQVKDKHLLAAGCSIEDLGSTEMGRLILNTDGRWSGATVQIPTLEYHTSYETTSRACIQSYYGFLHNCLVANPIIS